MTTTDREVLKVYGDRKSQPTRAIFIFCKVNGIDFEEVKIKLFSADVENPEFKAINPLKKIPAISHGEFTLFESHAILTYLASWYQVPDHWYLINTVLAPIFGKTSNHEVAAEYQQKLIESFSTIESLWLQGESKFLLGNDKPSLADLALVCEIMQLQMIPEEEKNKMIGPFKKVQQWIENVKDATNPHFQEVHQDFLDAIASAKHTV